MAGLKQRRSGWSGGTDLRNGALAVLRNKMVDECNLLICSLVHTFHYPLEPPIKVNAPRRWRLAEGKKATPAGSRIPLDSKCPDHTQFECVASRKADRTRDIQNIGGGWNQAANGEVIGTNSQILVRQRTLQLHAVDDWEDPLEQ